MTLHSDSRFSPQRVVLSFVSEPALKPEEYRTIADARKHMDTISRNIKDGGDALKGLSRLEKQNLLAYVTFSKENGFTHEDKGHTPIEDSARDLVREKDLFPSESELDKALVALLNKTKEKPFKEHLVLDARGVARAEA